MASFTRIHRAWAKEVDKKDREALKEQYMKLVAQDSTFAANVSFTTYRKDTKSDAVKALTTEKVDKKGDKHNPDLEICKYFSNHYGSKLSFNSEHTKTVLQTVETNVRYYNAVEKFISEEDKDSKYKKAYEAIQKKLDAYFAMAAEDILEDVYGKEYIDFKENYLKEQAEKKAEKAKKASK